MKQQLYILMLIISLHEVTAQVDQIDLSGSWNFALDSLDIGKKNKWFENSLQEKINLPGSTDQGNYGKVHANGTLLYDGRREIRRLARKRTYIGAAWYQRDITIPKNWNDKNVYLKLERCMWQTSLWVNDKLVGTRESLSVAHNFELTKYLRPEKNKITLRIDNRPFVHLGSWSHGYSPETQTIWNGAIGEIRLNAISKVQIQNIKTYPSFDDQELEVRFDISNSISKTKQGILNFEIIDPSNGRVMLSHDKTLKKEETSKTLSVKIPLQHKLQMWDEFNPQLYKLGIKGVVNKEQLDSVSITFGLRKVITENNRLIINGRKTFLRGEHDAGVSPLTGYPTMVKEDWLRIFKIGRSHGLNHWRFHSWCPPEAAFEAADELGIYLQPELPLFSQDWENTLIGQDSSRDEFLFSELKRILDAYGNHPSFVFMCMGNELRGDYKVLEKWVAWAKKYDDRHLYASSANLEAMGIYEPLKGDDFQVAHAAKYNGKRYERRMFPYFNKEVPNTEKNYEFTLKPPFDKWPIISHETGQWTVYPDFSEIPKYSGVLAPRNLEVFKSRLEQKGMLDQANDFLMATGKLSSILYREEMERLLRTPKMGGFQLLDLRDYPGQGSALVGVLNPFWESKGFISPEEFKQSCNDITLLLEMPKMVWQNNEVFQAKLVIPNYGKSDLQSVKIQWGIYFDDGRILQKGEIITGDVIQGDVNSIEDIQFGLGIIKQAGKYKVKLWSGELGVSNEYEIWVYPASGSVEIPGSIVVATKVDKSVIKALKNGKKVLLVTNKMADTERMAFTTPFWSTILFSYQAKTMGILCDPKHPVFNSFPTDFHSNWQWWDLTHNARAMRLNNLDKDYQPLLQVIDHPIRNDKLGAIAEVKVGKGKLLVCTLDILKNLDKRPVARQLNKSIVAYMLSDEFDPKENSILADKILEISKERNIEYRSVEASSENSEFPALFAIDGDFQSSWKSIFGTSIPIELKLHLETKRYITGVKFAGEASKTGIGKFKIFITDDPDKIGKPVILGDASNKNIFEAINWDNGFTMQKGKKGNHIILKIESITNPEKVIKLNEIQFEFGD